MKVYLPAGSLLTSSVYTRVGQSGTVVDTLVDWSLSLANSSGGLGIDPYLHYVDAASWTYDVYVDEPTGRFWYDDEIYY